MGAASAGSLNTSGFDQAVNSGQLPCHTHITHPGIFNQKFFEIGPKTDQLLDLHLGTGVSNCDLFDMDNRNFFLSMFLKSSKDGQKRNRGINICLTLDISGSMGGSLSYEPYDQNNLEPVKQVRKNRLQLSQDAIWMMFNKLEGEDIFSFVVFHNNSRTIIPSQKVKNLDKEIVRESIYQNFESGGTTIRAGFNEALINIKKHLSENPTFQHRIVLLTDVGDNSVQNENLLIQDISNSQSIHTTIIGVSTDFRSETCQKLKQVKGFNYLSAVKDEDLDTYLVKRFDYTFFPCAQKIEIQIEGDQIDKIEVFGSPDEGITYPKESGRFIVTKTNSIFPSQLNKNQKQMIETLGGLILVKFYPKNPQELPNLDLKVHLKYKDLTGKVYQKQYVIQQKIQAEEFYTNSATREGVMLFYYTQTLINLLKAIEKEKSDEKKILYAEKLGKLREYCPEFKKEQLQKVIKIVSKQ